MGMGWLGNISTKMFHTTFRDIFPTMGIVFTTPLIKVPNLNKQPVYSGVGHNISFACHYRTFYFYAMFIQLLSIVDIWVMHFLTQISTITQYCRYLSQKVHEKCPAFVVLCGRWGRKRTVIHNFTHSILGLPDSEIYTIEYFGVSNRHQATNSDLQ